MATPDKVNNVESISKVSTETKSIQLTEKLENKSIIN